MRPITIRSLPALSGLLLILAGCGGSPDETVPDGPGGQTLRGIVQIDGSSTVYPITEAVAEDFQQQHRDVRVTVGISGTGGGFKKFARGEADISNASRPIKGEEARAAQENGIQFIELPVAYDALSVVVNPKNTWVDHLSVAELKKIWEPGAQGRITRWNQVRPGWPDQPLKLYGAGSDSGTFDYFTDAIVGEEGASRGDYTASEDDNVLVQGVSRDVNALGFFGVAYYMENHDKLKAVPIDDGDASNGAGPQQPTVENVIAGTYQPLARPIFIYVSAKAAERPEVNAFVRYYLENAPRLVAEVDYVPLQDEVYALAKERYEKHTAGSIFAGGSQVGVKLQDLLKKEGG
jgi:phosphate transport system substrate-binding protein